MILALSEVRDLFRPFSLPGYFTQHTVWHLVGGVLWLALFLWLGVSSPFRWAIAAPAIRQGWCRETKGPGEFPLYAMVWDTATSVAASYGASLLWSLRG